MSNKSHGLATTVHSTDLTPGRAEAWPSSAQLTLYKSYKHYKPNFKSFNWGNNWYESMFYNCLNFLIVPSAYSDTQHIPIGTILGKGKSTIGSVRNFAKGVAAITGTQTGAWDNAYRVSRRMAIEGIDKYLQTMLYNIKKNNDKLPDYQYNSGDVKHVLNEVLNDTRYDDFFRVHDLKIDMKISGHDCLASAYGTLYVKNTQTTIGATPVVDVAAMPSSGTLPNEAIQVTATPVVDVAAISSSGTSPNEAIQVTATPVVAPAS